MLIQEQIVIGPGGSCAVPGNHDSGDESESSGQDYIARRTRSSPWRQSATPHVRRPAGTLTPACQRIHQVRSLSLVLPPVLCLPSSHRSEWNEPFSRCASDRIGRRAQSLGVSGRLSSIKVQPLATVRRRDLGQGPTPKRDCRSGCQVGARAAIWDVFHQVPFILMKANRASNEKPVVQQAHQEIGARTAPD